MLRGLQDKIVSWVGPYSWLSAVVFLMLRVHFGMGFYKAGQNKLANPEGMLSFFQSLNIGFPALGLDAQFFLTLVTYTELVGGILLAIGLLSRITAIPLGITMIVAYLTAHMDGIRASFPAFDPTSWDLGPMFAEAPAGFLLTCLLVMMYGPGRLSVDYLLGRTRSQKEAD